MNPALQNLPQGWFHHGEKILDLLVEHRPVVCVELGTWRGASAIAIARVVRSWGGVIYCVDTFTGGVNGGRTVTAPKMLGETAANVIRAGVAPSVRFVVTTTAAAAASWTHPIDFLLVDADHTREACAADLQAWWPHLRVGGLIAGDDYENPMYPGVKEAWDEFEHATGQHFNRFATPNTNPPGMRLVYGVKEGWL